MTDYLSSGASQRLQMRVERSPFLSCPTRVGLLHYGQITITLLMAMRDSCSAIPDLLRVRFELRCFFTIFTPSTSNFPSLGKTARTRLPSFTFLPRPAMTFTVSFL